MNLKFNILTISAFLFFGCSESAKNEKEELPSIDKTKRYEQLMHDGRDLAESGEYDEAILLFEQALALDTTKVEAYYGLGFAYGNKCREHSVGCDKSLYYLDHVIRIDSSYRYAYYNRAGCYMALEEFEKAIHDLDNQIAISKSEDPDYYANRAICYLELDDKSSAYKDYLQACLLDRSRQSAYMDSIFENSSIPEVSDSH